MANTRGCWSQKCEDGVNGQINLELHACYVYQAMGHFFDRHDVDLHNISEYFKECSKEEREHADKLMTFQNKRLGNIKLSAIQPPPAFDPANFNIKKAMMAALALEETVNKSLLELHETGEGDPEFQDFIEANFLHEQVDAIKELKGYIRNLDRCGEGLGEFLFDKNFKK